MHTAASLRGSAERTRLRLPCTSPSNAAQLATDKQSVPPSGSPPLGRGMLRGDMGPLQRQGPLQLGGMVLGGAGLPVLHLLHLPGGAGLPILQLLHLPDRRPA